IRERDSAPGVVRVAGAWGSSPLTPRRRSALVAALASASIFALVHSATAETTTTEGAKSAPRTTVKTVVKHSKHTKKVAKAKDKKSAGAKVASLEVPLPRVRPDAQEPPPAPYATALTRISPSKVPLAQAPSPETSEGDIALIERAIEAMRESGTSEATR